jgi:hypothetical protein
VNPCGAAHVTVATCAFQVIVLMASAPLSSGVNADSDDRKVSVPCAVLVAPWEISAPVFCSALGVGATCVEIFTETMGFVMGASPSG